MTIVTEYFRGLWQVTREGWDRFWFTPADAATLAVIRIMAGGMLLYTHAVWGIDLAGFFGPDSRISMEFVDAFHQSPWSWTFWRWVHSDPLMWAIHAIALVVFVLVTVGLITRVATVLAFLIASAYAHRAAGALFGLDQINLMLILYLMIGNAGDVYSLDAWWRRRRDPTWQATPTIQTNIALRLMQLHLCVIYFFAALGKLQGESWWDGMAMWLALANYEYQSIDVTYLAHWPWLINLLTHVSLLWELTYPVLIWPRWTRPLVLALAVPLHGGIAFCLGMMTFGTIMLVANLSFVPAAVTRAAVAAVADRGQRRAQRGTATGPRHRPPRRRDRDRVPYRPGGTTDSSPRPPDL